MTRGRLALALAAGLGAATACHGTADTRRGGEPPPWRPVEEFVPVVFGGDGGVHRDDDALVLEAGEPLTGVTFPVALPGGDYELELQATRVRGVDFFCGLTFPTPNGPLTLVLGGWGGAVCGLSCLDDLDAAHNDTRTLRHFDRGRPYRVRVRVTGDAVAAFIDDAPLLQASLLGRRAEVRAELLLCRPFGFAAFRTTAELRGLRWRPLR